MDKQIKFFEVRDAGTHIPTMAVRLYSEDEKESKIIARGGHETNPQYWLTVMVTTLHNGKSEWDPFKWDSNRTMKTAHGYIRDNFDQLSSGDVVDVEYILGESAVPKVSEL